MKGPVLYMVNIDDLNWIQRLKFVRGIFNLEDTYSIGNGMDAVLLFYIGETIKQQQT